MEKRIQKKEVLKKVPLTTSPIKKPVTSIKVPITNPSIKISSKKIVAKVPLKNSSIKKPVTSAKAPTKIPSKKIIKKTPSQLTKVKNSSYTIQRVKTGIQGFDELIEGGLPLNSSTVICGSFGSGKTIFGLHFIYNGIMKYGEKGVIISFDSKKEAIMNQAKKLGWDFGKLEKENKLIVLSFDVLNITSVLFEQIKKSVEKIGAKRVVFDSLTDLAINVGKNMNGSNSSEGKYSTEQFIYYVIHKLRDLNTTIIFTSSSSCDKEYVTRDTVSEYLCDNVVWIKFQSMGGAYSRTLIVRKARRTKNDEDIHPMEIGDKGIIIHTIK